jgi:NitT/TauT family transport system permease protein/taurine transport system permease protein
MSFVTTDRERLDADLAASRVRKLVATIARYSSGFVIVVAVWQLAAMLLGVSRSLFPWPADVVAAAVELIDRGILYAYTKASLWRYLAGVALGTAIGLLLGLLIAASRWVSSMLSPVISFLYAIVDVAWIPLFIIWWGYGIKIVLASLIYVVAFPVLYNTILGVKSLPKVYLNAARSMGASRSQIFLNVVLPGILPQVLTGFRVGAGFAFRALIFAEMVAAQDGLGYLIFSSTASQQTARTMVGMLAMGVIWLSIDRFYLRPLERASVERWGTVSTGEKL